MFEVITVPAESYESLAPLGTKPKFWFASTLHGMPAVECLFKEVRPDTGEDWAEKMASELCSLLGTRDQRRAMPCYVTRAKSAFFASPARKERLSTVEAFREAGRIRPVAAHSWLERLADVSFSAVQGGFAELPPDRITPVAIEFALKMLELNRQRLVALHEEFR